MPSHGLTALWYLQQLPGLPQLFLGTGTNSWDQTIVIFSLAPCEDLAAEQSLAQQAARQASEYQITATSPPVCREQTPEKMLSFQPLVHVPKLLGLPQFVGQRWCARTCPEVISVFSCRAQDSQVAVSIFQSLIWIGWGPGGWQGARGRERQPLQQSAVGRAGLASPTLGISQEGSVFFLKATTRAVAA